MSIFFGCVSLQTMKKDYDYALLIGRFQPFHRGHFALYQKACLLADKVIVVIGSHQRSSSLLDPWTSEERCKMISQHCRTMPPSFLFMQDSAYNFPEWRRRLKTMLRAQLQLDGADENASVVVLGHLRDQSSYYLKFFEPWHFYAVAEQANGCNASDIRKALFEARLDAVDSELDANNLDFIKQWTNTDAFMRLANEYRDLEIASRNLQAKTSEQRSVLACLVYRDFVVLEHRDTHPGKGQFALPEKILDDTQEPNQEVSQLFKELDQDVGAAGVQHSNHAVFDQLRRDPRGKLTSYADCWLLEARPQLSNPKFFCYDLALLNEQTALFASDHAQIIQYFLNRLS